jgi:hypothetical protein
MLAYCGKIRNSSGDIEPVYLVRKPSHPWREEYTQMLQNLLVDFAGRRAENP